MYSRPLQIEQIDDYRISRSITGHAVYNDVGDIRTWCRLI